MFRDLTAHAYHLPNRRRNPTKVSMASRIMVLSGRSLPSLSGALPRVAGWSDDEDWAPVRSSSCPST